MDIKWNRPCEYRAEKVTIFVAYLPTFSALNTNMYKTCKLHMAIFSVFYKILLPNSFTDFKMSFQAVVKDFVFLA